MKPLSYLLRGVKYLNLVGSKNQLIKNVQFDYKKVSHKDVYFALIYPGREGNKPSDGHDYIDHAIQRGAKVIVCENLPANIVENITYLQVENCHEVMAIMVDNYYGNPSKEIRVIGVTGSNGKTSVVHLLNQLFHNLGYRTGLISTGVNIIGDEVITDYGTTPNAIALYRLLREMVNKNCEYCFLETTSHSIFQKRVAPIDYVGTIFTSLSPDHLGYHGTFEEYAKVKKALFDGVSEQSFVIYNSDDSHGAAMVSDSKAANIKSVSIKNEEADFYLKVLKNSFDGLTLELAGQTIHSSLVGGFYATNLLIVYATAIMAGVDKSKLIRALTTLKKVGGRFNVFKSENNVFGIVDHAHNLGGLENLFAEIKPMVENRLITIIGCGGDRVRKRSKIGQLVYEQSDYAIWTSDNPRGEEPADIIAEMLSEINPDPLKSTIIIDRRAAIIYACEMAQPGDVLLLASKGDETYQEYKDGKVPFSDIDILLEQFSQLVEA